MTRHLLIIGAQRCGTTYLRELLDAHPQIAMARPARPEPKVFVSDELSGRGAEWYRSTFFAHAEPGQLLGDKSTSYLEDPRAAGRAAETLGEVDVAVQFRDPVARAVSNWRFSVANGFETRELGDALEENLHTSREWAGAATSVSPFAYLERGRYADCLRPWLDRFPGRVHVLFLEEVIADLLPLRAMLEALGVDSQAALPAARRAVNASEGAPPALAPTLVSRMRAYFRDADEALARIVGRSLPWASPSEPGAAGG